MTRLRYHLYTKPVLLSWERRPNCCLSDSPFLSAELGIKDEVGQVRENGSSLTPRQNYANSVPIDDDDDDDDDDDISQTKTVAFYT